MTNTTTISNSLSNSLSLINSLWEKAILADEKAILAPNKVSRRQARITLNRVVRAERAVEAAISALVDTQGLTPVTRYNDAELTEWGKSLIHQALLTAETGLVAIATSLIEAYADTDWETVRQLGAIDLSRFLASGFKASYVIDERNGVDQWSSVLPWSMVGQNMPLGRREVDLSREPQWGTWVHVFNRDTSDFREVSRIHGEVCVSRYEKGGVYYTQLNKWVGAVLEGLCSAHWEHDVWSIIGPDGIRYPTRAPDEAQSHHSEGFLWAASARCVRLIISAEHSAKEARALAWENDLPVEIEGGAIILPDDYWENEWEEEWDEAEEEEEYYN